REKIDHPSPRPLPQVQYVIEIASQPGATIFDPFAGSGTTGVACMKTGRKFIGIEIDPGYFAIAKRRIEDACAQLPLFTEATHAPGR
ncbi:MAG: DNA methyltransferase, partial [Thiobacillus sp.]